MYITPRYETIFHTFFTLRRAFLINLITSDIKKSEIKFFEAMFAP